jgi:thiosulfate dehydrogenase
MKLSAKILTALLAISTMSGLVYFVEEHSSSLALAQQLPAHQTGTAANGGVVVELCDGVTKMEVKGLQPGHAMTHAQALAVTGSLMAEWARKHPGEHWEMAQDSSSPDAPAGAGASAQPPASPAATASPSSTEAPTEAASPVAASSVPPTQAATSAATATEEPDAEETEAAPKSSAQSKPTEKSQPASGNAVISGPGHKQSPPLQQGDTYASFNERDFKVWHANTDRFVQQGKEVFHSADQLGGTIGVSCDMCHPDAANTHPETYPKYQVQLQRVALLRDMIEWCIENPVKGKTMDPNDPRLRALEAYILAQRKGVALDYGKH